MKNILRTVSICTAFVMSSSAFAQGTGDLVTGSGSTGSGIQMEQQETVSLENIQQKAAQILWQNRVARTENFRENVLKNRNEEVEENEELMTIQKERKDNRDECLVSIRRASKLTQFSIYADCYQNELSYELEILTIKKAQLEKEAGITDDVRWLTMTRLELLIDALSVVVNALESNVYESVEELQEAKVSLYENYRKPYWVMVSRVNADRLLTWVATIMIRIDEISNSSEEVPQEEARVLIDGLNCLSEEEFLLQSVLRSQDLNESRVMLAEARVKLNECLGLLRGINRVRNNAIEEARQAEEEEKQAEEAAIEAEKSKLSRRLQRRLNYEYRVLGESSNVQEEEEAPAEEEEEEVEMQPAAPKNTLSRRLLRRFRDEEMRVNEQ